jgi:hypothetical protein
MYLLQFKQKYFLLFTILSLLLTTEYITEITFSFEIHVI